MNHSDLENMKIAFLQQKAEEAKKTGNSDLYDKLLSSIQLISVSSNIADEYIEIDALIEPSMGTGAKRSSP